MTQEQTEITSIQKSGFAGRISDYIALTKLRLALLVVFSAGAGYAMGPGALDWKVILYLIAGGFLVTGSSNGFNQIIERDLDKLMNRTKTRPLPAGRISVLESVIFSAVIGIAGLTMLWLINPYTFMLGFLALFSYVAIYTPLKRKSPLCVFVGAFPGSVPPLLGYVAAANAFGLEAGVLFLVQFFWQFPHFWAIAWKANEDYLKAGFRMLPLREGRTKRSAWLIFLFTMFMLPVSILPWTFDMTYGLITVITGVGASIVFIIPAYKLYQTCDVKHAKTLMYISFLYLPILQIAYIIDKVEI